MIFNKKNVDHRICFLSNEKGCSIIQLKRSIIDMNKKHKEKKFNTKKIMKKNDMF